MASFMHSRSKVNGSTEELPPDKTMFLKQVTYGFIKYFEENFDKLVPPSIPQAIQVQIEAMAEFVAYMRASVERTGRSEDVSYRQTIEVPTRLVQQLTRLPFCLALILGKQEIDVEVMDITRKVMVDTSCGFQYEIAEQLSKLDEYNGLSVSHLARLLSLSDATVRRLADDMIELGILGSVKVRNNSGNRGRNAHLLQLSDKMRKVWSLVMGTKPAKPVVRTTAQKVKR
jgi:hypothetical protein